MYLQTLLIFIVTAALAGAWLDAASLALSANARHAAATYAAAGLERAQGDLLEALAAQAQAAGPPFSAPSPGPAAPVCVPASADGAACALFVRTAAVLGGQTSSAPGGVSVTGVPAANAVAANLQGTSGAVETRIAAALSATVTNAAGAVLASKTRRVVLRVFPAPPWTAVVASEESAIGASPVPDFGGTCTGGDCGSDNRIRAVYRCADPQQPARCNGVPDRTVDRFMSPAWYDDNVATPAWNR